MVSKYFTVWISVIAITVIVGILLQGSVPDIILYFSVSLASLVFVIYQAKNWDYVGRRDI